MYMNINPALGMNLRGNAIPGIEKLLPERSRTTCRPLTMSETLMRHYHSFFTARGRWASNSGGMQESGRAWNMNCHPCITQKRNTSKTPMGLGKGKRGRIIIHA